MNSNQNSEIRLDKLTYKLETLFKCFYCKKPIDPEKLLFCNCPNCGARVSSKSGKLATIKVESYVYRPNWFAKVFKKSPVVYFAASGLKKDQDWLNRYFNTIEMPLPEQLVKSELTSSDRKSR